MDLTSKSSFNWILKFNSGKWSLYKLSFTVLFWGILCIRLIPFLVEIWFQNTLGWNMMQYITMHKCYWRVTSSAGASSSFAHYSYYSSPSASTRRYRSLRCYLGAPCHVHSVQYLKDRKRLRGVKLLMFVLRGPACLHDRKNDRRFLSTGYACSDC